MRNFTPDTLEELEKRLNSFNVNNWKNTLIPFSNKVLNKQEVYCFDGKIYVHYDAWVKLVFYYLGSSEEALNLIFYYAKLKIESNINDFVFEYKKYDNFMTILRKTHLLSFNQQNNATIQHILLHKPF